MILLLTLEETNTCFHINQQEISFKKCYFNISYIAVGNVV